MSELKTPKLPKSLKRCKLCKKAWAICKCFGALPPEKILSIAAADELVGTLKTYHDALQKIADIFEPEDLSAVALEPLWLCRCGVSDSSVEIMQHDPDCAGMIAKSALAGSK